MCRIDAGIDGLAGRSRWDVSSEQAGVDPGRIVQEWLSTADAARYLGLTSHRIRVEFAAGRLPGSRLGYRTLRFRREHLDAVMESLIVLGEQKMPAATSGVSNLVPHKRRGISQKLGL